MRADVLARARRWPESSSAVSAESRKSRRTTHRGPGPGARWPTLGGGGSAAPGRGRAPGEEAVPRPRTRAARRHRDPRSRTLRRTRRDRGRALPPSRASSPAQGSARPVPRSATGTAPAGSAIPRRACSCRSTPATTAGSSAGGHASPSSAPSTMLPARSSPCAFHEKEDARGYFLLLREVCGLPQALYTDRHSIFWPTNGPTLQEQLAGRRSPTQFGRAMAELGIQLIAAHSPQASVERLWGTLQDRLVSELRLADVFTLEAANASLPGFYAAFNRTFSLTPETPGSAYRPRLTAAAPRHRPLLQARARRQQGQLRTPRPGGAPAPPRASPHRLHPHHRHDLRDPRPPPPRALRRP